MKKLVQFELRKIFSRRLTQVALAVLLLITVFLCFFTYHNMHSFDGINNEGSGHIAVEIDKSIAEKYEGILTDEKIQQIMSDFSPKFDLNGMNAAYLYQNAMQSAAFARFSDSDGNWNGLSVSDVYGNEEINIGYINGWLSTSENMAKSYIVLALVIIIMLAPVYSGEYGGVDNIILTSRYGRTKCAAAKIFAGVLSAILLTAFISIINLAAAYILYGANGLKCSILFSPIDYADAYIPFNITCGMLIKYQILLAFTSAVSITGITLIISAMCKNQMIALAASLAAFLFPVMIPAPEASALFRYITLLPLYHVQFISLMSVEQMRGGVLYAVFAVPVALIFIGIGAFASRRIFAKHQIL